MNIEEFKVVLQTVTVGLSFLGGIVALVQWRRDQAWKKAEKLDSMYKEFEGSRLIQIACRILDWSRGNFRFPDGEHFDFDKPDVEKSLMVHEDFPAEMKFSLTQARMRDAYDALFSFFERLESAIDSGLIDSRSAMALFGYWIRHVDTMPEHEGCAPRMMKYITRYASLATFNSLCGRLNGC